MTYSLKATKKGVILTWNSPKGEQKKEFASKKLAMDHITVGEE